MRYLCFCALCLLFLAKGNAWADTLYLDGPPEKPIALAQFIQIHEDSAGKQGIAEIAPLADAQVPGFFRKATVGDFRPGFSHSAWWLRLELANISPSQQTLILKLGGDAANQIDVYLRREGVWERSDTGSEIDLQRNGAAWRLGGQTFYLDSGEKLPILFRVRSDAPIRLDPYLYSIQGFQDQQRTASIWNATLIGATLALGLCALLMAVAYRGATYGWLALLCAAVAAYEFTSQGYTELYIWPGAGIWSYRGELAIGCLCLALTFAFARSVATRDKAVIPGGGLLTALALPLLAFSLASPWGDVRALSLLAFGIGIPLGIWMLLCALRMSRAAPSTAILIAVAASLILFNLVAKAFVPIKLALAVHTVPTGLDAGAGITLMGIMMNLVVLVACASRPTIVNLNQELYAAKEDSRQKVEMLGCIGHDLRAPLATIAGYVSLLRQTNAADSDQHLAAIEQSVRYQLGLIDDMLQYAKGELQPLSITPTSVLPGQLLEEVAHFGIALATQRGNAFRYTPPPMLPEKIRLDGSRLQQALLNLISNAAKFTQHGSVELRVSARPLNDELGQWRIKFTVIDDGIGIEVTRQAEIFEAFKQLHATEGVGLGLFIVDRIVKNLGGALTLHSAPGRGSRFSFAITVSALGNGQVAAMPLHVRPALRQEPVIVAQPPLFVRHTLADLAAKGKISSIAAWLDSNSAAYPHCAVFFAEARHALRQLDLERLRKLAMPQAIPATTADPAPPSVQRPLSGVSSNSVTV